MPTLRPPSGEPATEAPTSARRRITLRRSRYGADSLNQATEARGMRGASTSSDVDDADAVDLAVDPDHFTEEPTADAASRLNRAVRDRAPVVIDADGMGGPPDRANPRARLDEVAQSGSAAYAKEYRLSLLHRLLMRRVPIDQIARQLNVSISTIEKDRVALKQRLREAAKELDINEIVGRNVEIYDEVRGMALRVASTGDQASDGRAAVPVAMKLAAMRTALAATNDANRMLSAAGVFDALRFRAAETATGQTDMQRLMAGADDILRQVLGDEEDAGTPPTSPPRAKARSGFAPLDYADPDADSAAQELVDL